jgi:hypothetical protein
VRVVAIVLLLALSGCFVQIRDERAAEVVGLAIFTGVFVGNAIEESRNPRPMPSLSVFSDWVGGPPPAPMAPDRKVSEQDCSKPIDTTLGNIKCR